MKPTRADVKAILDYLLARSINLQQAHDRLAALGLQVKAELHHFSYGSMSYDDVFKAFGV